MPYRPAKRPKNHPLGPLPDIRPVSSKADYSKATKCDVPSERSSKADKLAASLSPLRASKKLNRAVLSFDCSDDEGAGQTVAVSLPEAPISKNPENKDLPVGGFKKLKKRRRKFKARARKRTSNREEEE